MAVSGNSPAKKLVVIGGATCLLEVADLVADINAVGGRYEVMGALDDNKDLHGELVGGIRILGGLDRAQEMPSDVLFVFAIASYTLRMSRLAILNALGIPRERFATLIHPAAKVSANASIGVGGLIYSGAVFMPCCRLGDFVVVYGNAVVGPMASVGDFVALGSLAYVGGGADVGAAAFIGASATVVDGVCVGDGALIGAGSVAVRDVAPGATAVGNPARIIKNEKSLT